MRNRVVHAGEARCAVAARRAGLSCGRVAALAVVMLAAWLASAGQAQGSSCGHYVVIGNPSAAAKDHQAMSQHAAQPTSPDRAPAPRPCDGPTCRGGDSTPLAPPAPPTVSSHDQLAALLVDADATSAFACAKSSGDDALAAQAHLRSLDPPPRA